MGIKLTKQSFAEIGYMKTFLIPIDYSPCAYNAVRYGVHMAKIMNANIHLCHAISTLEINPVVEMMAWSAENYDTLKTNAEDTIKEFIHKLKIEQDFNFEITFSTDTIPIKEMVNKLIKTMKPDLILMGTSGAGNVARFFLGSTSRALIEKTKVPVLLIPKHVNYVPIKKIAFATDLTESDIFTVHNLARLFCLYNPEILLTHVGKEVSGKSNLFLNQVTSKINYSKIYFRQIKDADVDAGLNWLTTHGQMEILAMIHRKKTNVFSNLLLGSHTQKMAKQLELPLLVMPEVVD